VRELAFVHDGHGDEHPVYYDAVLARSADGMQVFLDAHAPVPNSNIGDGDSIWLSRPLKALASMFLEGIRSNSPFYRFLLLQRSLSHKQRHEKSTSGALRE
jgi:hypothetical protein